MIMYLSIPCLLLHLAIKLPNKTLQKTHGSHFNQVYTLTKGNKQRRCIVQPNKTKTCNAELKSVFNVSRSWIPGGDPRIHVAPVKELQCHIITNPDKNII
jgi:hypothetical protein